VPSAWDQIVNAMNWGGVGEGMPEHYGREKLMDPMAAGLTGLTSLPERAFGASEQMRQGGPYDPGPAVEAAMLPMGTGGIAGVPMAAGEAAFGSGIIRPKPLIEGYHGTASRTPFDRLKTSGEDVGVHLSTNPTTSALYSLTPEAGVGLAEASPRTMPVVADINKPLRYPANPVDWRDPNMVMGFLDHFLADGYKFPKGALSALESAAVQGGGFEKNLIPSLQQRGYDAIQYPHSPGRGYDSYMAFDPKQVVPKFSSEGQSLISARGVRNPGKKINWDDLEEGMGVPLEELGILRRHK
jgi:hypothetical protein